MTIFFILILILFSGCAFPSKQIKQEEYALMNNYAVRCAEHSLWKEAKIWLEKAKKLNPFCANIYNNLGVVYEHFGLTELAKDAYKKAIELNPKERIYIENLESLEELLRKRRERGEEEIKSGD